MKKTRSDSPTFKSTGARESLAPTSDLMRFEFQRPPFATLATYVALAVTACSPRATDQPPAGATRTPTDAPRNTPPDPSPDAANPPHFPDDFGADGGPTRGHPPAPDSTTSVCPSGVLGDLNALIAFSATASNGAADAPLNDGDSIPLLLAPRGGASCS